MTAKQTSSLQLAKLHLESVKKEHSAGDWNVLRFYTMQSTAAKPGRIAGWLVHAYTASGAVLAFAGTWAVVHGYDRLALASMFAATVVDGTDGVLARRVEVRRVLPEIDGTRIDDIVDYITFVFLWKYWKDRSN